MDAAQQRQKAYADVHRRHVSYKVGERVLLNSRNLELKMPGTTKLFPKFVGPFKIVKIVNDVAYKLELPETMQVHDVFHVSLLKPYSDDPNVAPPPAPIVVDGELEYTVERIMRHRDKRYGRTTKREFLVRWLDYGPEHDTWEPESNMSNSTEAIADYWSAVTSKAQCFEATQEACPCYCFRT